MVNGGTRELAIGEVLGWESFLRRSMASWSRGGPLLLVVGKVHDSKHLYIHRRTHNLSFITPHFSFLSL